MPDLLVGSVAKCGSSQSIHSPTEPDWTPVDPAVQSPPPAHPVHASPPVPVPEGPICAPRRVGFLQLAKARHPYPATHSHPLQLAWTPNSRCGS